MATEHGVESTANQAPDLGPTLPIYPELPQILRVTSPALAGTSPPVYPALMQQYAPPLMMRDREPAYVWEPNGFPLGPARYDCRLVGSYLGLPLYATTCCATGIFSSVSPASVGSSAASGTSGSAVPSSPSSPSPLKSPSASSRSPSSSSSHSSNSSHA
jgi:hypothetical protein